MKRVTFLLGCIVLVVSATGSVHAATWYVDTGNTSGTQDGTSWATAFATIQPAIDAASGQGGGQVWVAAGTYAEARADASGALVMRENVYLYGGFAGTETVRDDRDWTANVTVIDGSTARGGQAAYHVVKGANSAGLNGFTITGGNANGAGEDANGGGMYNSGVSPVVANCVFTGNAATLGGGMYNAAGAAPQVTDCTFVANSAASGRGDPQRRGLSRRVGVRVHGQCRQRVRRGHLQR